MQTQKKKRKKKKKKEETNPPPHSPNAYVATQKHACKDILL